MVATQPVEGEYYLVNSITLNDGTVIEADEVEKYATFTWKAEKADGTVVYTKSTNDRNVTGTFWGIADTKKFDGCYITLEVAAKKDAGVFGTVVWGDEADPLAIADRISGNNRYETAYAVAEKLKSAYATNGKFNAIVVANGDTYCDALAGTALATAKKAPIILVNDKNEAAAIDYVKENMIYNGTVYILGGEGVVSADFAKAVDKYNVKRLGGDDRYATNIAILEEIGAGTKSQIVIVSGTDFADALSAAATKIPVMLAGDQLSVEQKALLTEIGYKEVFVVGGTGAVNTVVAEQAALYGDSDRVAERIAGANRYETSTKVALRFFGAADNMVLATGNDFADALTGGVLAAEEGYPILLVNEYNTQQANDYVNYDNTVSDGFVVIGGQGAISNELVQKVAAQKIA